MCYLLDTLEFNSPLPIWFFKGKEYKNLVLSNILILGTCEESFFDLNLFLNHLTNHLHEALTVYFDVKESLWCQWRCCKLPLGMDYQQFTRHVLYHGFHSKLKSNGAHVLHASKVAVECMLDTASRNMIPELPETFACCWKDCEVRFIKLVFK